jgi:hypothetical protein
MTISSPNLTECPARKRRPVGGGRLDLRIARSARGSDLKRVAGPTSGMFRLLQLSNDMVARHDNLTIANLRIRTPEARGSARAAGGVIPANMLSTDRRAGARWVPTPYRRGLPGGEAAAFPRASAKVASRPSRRGPHPRKASTHGSLYRNLNNFTRTLLGSTRNEVDTFAPMRPARREDRVANDLDRAGA